MFNYEHGTVYSKQEKLSVGDVIVIKREMVGRLFCMLPETEDPKWLSTWSYGFRIKSLKPKES